MVLFTLFSREFCFKKKGFFIYELLHLHRSQNIPSALAGDSELMKFAIKGTEAEWNKALDGKEVGSAGLVQIKSKTNEPTKRKLNQEDVDKEAGIAPKGHKKKKKNKKQRK